MRNSTEKDLPKAGISGMERLLDTTLSEWYDAKHRDPCRDEVDLVNSLPINGCPWCAGTRFIRFGYQANGIRKYKCKDCGKTFTPLTGTLFDNHRIPVSEWVEFLMHLMEFHSISSFARDNRNARNTGIYWLNKVFLCLRGCQESVVLSGRVYIDETYFKVMPKEEIHRPDGKLLAGISRNKICVACAYDGTNRFLVLCGKAKPSKEEMRNAFAGHIEHGSVLVHDGERAHKSLMDDYGLTEERHPTKETHGLPNGRNPMEPINAVHRELKKFMRQHPAFDRDDLQDWLNLFWFITKDTRDMKERVMELLQRAILTHEVVKYRDVLGKKSRK